MLKRSPGQIMRRHGRYCLECGAPLGKDDGRLCKRCEIAQRHVIGELADKVESIERLI